MQKMFIAAGILFILAGLLWPWLSKISFGRLTGDIIIEKENFKFFFPLATMILMSVLLTLLFWIWRKFW